MESDDDLGSTRLDVCFAPHTGVVPRTATDGIDAPRWGPETLGKAVTLAADKVGRCTRLHNALFSPLSLPADPLHQLSSGSR